MDSPQRLTREQVRQLDRLAIEEYGIPGIVLMENAGRNAARVIRQILTPDADAAPPPTGSTPAAPPPVAIVCGAGNNGGDGFVIARHLFNCGFVVELYLASDPARFSGDAAVNYTITQRMQLPTLSITEPDTLAAAAKRWPASLAVVDAMLGTGFSGQVRQPLDRIVHAINALRPARPVAAAPSPPPRPVLFAIDVPSGLDADTGLPANAAVQADITITMAAHKVGFAATEAIPFVGRVVLVDIGSPRGLVEKVAGRKP